MNKNFVVRMAITTAVAAVCVTPALADDFKCLVHTSAERYGIAFVDTTDLRAARTHARGTIALTAEGPATARSVVECKPLDERFATRAGRQLDDIIPR